MTGAAIAAIRASRNRGGSRSAAISPAACRRRTSATSAGSPDSGAGASCLWSIPVLLLSGVLLPLSLAPAWLSALSYANPLRYAADAARALVHGHPETTDAIRGLAVCGAFALAAAAWSIRHFRRSVA